MSASLRLLTFAQAAERCQCDERTLRRAASTGGLLVTRLGKGPKSDRIHPTDLAVWLASRRVSRCPSRNAQTEAIKLPSATAAERIERLLGTGRTPTPARSNATGSQPSRTLRLVGSPKGS